MGAFDILVKKLVDKGHDEESAKRIAAAVGRKKYGKREFAAMAAAGRRKQYNMNQQYKNAVLKSANSIRSIHGLSELNLSFFEEDLHPRGRGGKFASKGSNTESSQSYDREAIRSKIREQDSAKAAEQSAEESKKNRKKLFNSLAMAAIIGTAIAGHPHIAAVIAAPWAGYELAKAANNMRIAARNAVLKYAIKHVSRAANIPFTNTNITELIRGKGKKDLPIFD